MTGYPPDDEAAKVALVLFACLCLVLLIIYLTGYRVP